MSSQTPKPPRKAPYSDIDLHRWRDYDHLLTDSLWMFPQRAKGDGHRLDYHGNFIPQLATQLFSRYTRQDDVILDMFLGSGTSALEAINLQRRCIGVELKPDLIAAVRRKIPAAYLTERVRLICGNSASPGIIPPIRRELAALGEKFAHLLILHPPYDDIIKFSDHPDDLSNAANTEIFLERFEAVARHGYALLEPGRFAAVIIGDKYTHGELIPLGFWCLERMNRAGFKTKAIIVKDIQGNEKGKGQATNLWRYRALAGGYYIFKHEYILVMFKPQKSRTKLKKST